MEISKLEIGMRLKSYKELAEVLEMKVTNGKSKTLQIQELERFVKYHKEGNAFVIDEIFPEPLEKVDLRASGNHNKFANNIEVILLFLLNKAEDSRAMYSTTRLLRLCNMVNDNYVNGRHEMEKLAKELDVDRDDVSYFYGNSYSELKRTVEYALRRMAGKSLLFYNTNVIVCERAKDKDAPSSGVWKDTINYREATQKEKTTILKIERETMLELGCTNISDIHLKGHRGNFYRTVNKKLKRVTNLTFYYHVYDLVLNKEGIAQEVKSYKEALEDINDNAVEKFTVKTQRREDKALKHGWGRITSVEQKREFLEHQLVLIDMLISNQAPTIQLS